MILKNKNIKLVILGGGTGLSNVLTALKDDYDKIIKKLTAIVTVADSGGSSGYLKKIFDIPAIGDIRNCLLALSNIENYFKEIFQKRFSKGNGLKGHPLGNLFLVSLIENEGDFLRAIKKASKILKINGEIMPSCLEKIDLVARFENGKTIVGEENIVKYGISKKLRIKELKIKPQNIKSPPQVIKRIRAADIIIFSPGSLYTSILPNLLINDIRRAVINSKALRIFMINLLTQPGETDNFTAFDHLSEFLRISKLPKVDICIVNTKKLPANKISILKNENKKMVLPDVDKIKKIGIKIYSGNFINEKDIYLKHDPKKISKTIFKIIKDYF
ncbi:MAG: putative gluconeogenesis factor [Candidatus Parcubacteria bacterium]|nr:MAG: putative gluconeogenesis factor [Candidatus Parcubacteria bacterium]